MWCRVLREKRNAKDTKVTDMLYACYALVGSGRGVLDSSDEDQGPLRLDYQRINLKLSLEDEFRKISENFKQKAGVDYAASRGEYLNGIIMANYLGYEFIDAAEVIFFNGKGEFDAERTNEVLAARLATW